MNAMHGNTALARVSSLPDAPQPTGGQAKYIPLWLCVDLPQLSLEVFAADDDITPRAVIAQSGQRTLVHAVSTAAQRSGVTPGIPLARAQALCPTLQVQSRDLKREVNRLEELAAWAFRFTPTVSIEQPRGLLLEVRGSQRLFGGLANLQSELRNNLKERQIYFQTAVAPTPRGSLMLARYRSTVTVFNNAAMRSALGELPVAALPLDSKALRRLRGTGVRTLRELMRLPRGGLARRYGNGFVRMLDQTFSIVPEPRQTFRLPHEFETAIDLPAETTDTALIEMAAQRLLVALATYLRTRDCATDRLRVDLHHTHRPPSRITIGLRCGTRDISQLMGLLREHLNQVALPAPVVRLTLATETVQPFAPEPQTLFTDASTRGSDAEPSHTLFDRLEARLGADSIGRLARRADHRPEYAWSDAQRRAPHIACRFPRPPWLLSHPWQLAVRQGQPWRRGPLTLHGNAERIESGWWSGGDIRRDYYTAAESDGSQLWVFQDLRGGGWYLHGLFA